MSTCTERDLYLTLQEKKRKYSVSAREEILLTMSKKESPPPPPFRISNDPPLRREGCHASTDFQKREVYLLGIGSG